MVSTRQAYGETLAKLGDKYENIVVLDADLAEATKTGMFKKKFPDRFFDMGIAEADMIGTAAGLSTCGKIPFASSFAMFAVGRAFEQVRNSIAYPNLNVKIAATHAGVTVGEDGATHQAIEDIALMRAVPNMNVICPCDQYEAAWAIEEAAKINGPVYIRLGRSDVPDIYDQNMKFEFGKGVEIKEGNDVTIIATGIMVVKAIEASERLKEEGINARVIDIHTIKPIDKEIIIKSAKETRGIVVAEEHSIIGGLGGAVAEVISENHPTKVLRIGVEDVFGQSGKASELLEEYGLTCEKIIKKAQEILKY
ncbi:MAG: transketolase family protein [Clostridiales bacterium]|nr:transketolase family protein [Clostridiales bacterium]